MPDHWSLEETDELHADRRNFYKVEKWTEDGQHIKEMMFAGSDLEKAKRIFGRFIKKRPTSRLTIRQRGRVLIEWPLRD
jgi:hypothetical protein